MYINDLNRKRSQMEQANIKKLTTSLPTPYIMVKRDLVLRHSALISPKIIPGIIR